MEYGDQLLLPGHDSHEFREGYESAQKGQVRIRKHFCLELELGIGRNPCGRRGDGGRDGEAEDF
jgi:hypothetical protein